ncbi:MAG: potassium transporter KefB [Hymenobacteraceae bacterium]|nr:potassium transporter KefB [Hymenobacteraceae bacterium]
MTQINESHKHEFHPVALVAPMLAGAAVALLVISFFVFGVDAPRPEWGNYWMVKPLILTPLAGALGGAFYAFMSYQTARGFNRILAVVLSVVVYLVVLWLGIVLGLNGTLWD